MNNGSLIIEKTMNAPVEKVWAAITDKNAMKQWGFDVAEFRPEVGFEFRFEGGDGCNNFLHNCRILEVIQNKKLVYTWQYEGYAGDSVVTYELFAEGSKTRVKLTHEGLETIAVNGPAFAVSNFEAGWNEIIGKVLKEIVEEARL